MWTSYHIAPGYGSAPPIYYSESHTTASNHIQNIEKCQQYMDTFSLRSESHRMVRTFLSRASDSDSLFMDPPYLLTHEQTSQVQKFLSQKANTPIQYHSVFTEVENYMKQINSNNTYYIKLSSEEVSRRKQKVKELQQERKKECEMNHAQPPSWWQRFQCITSNILCCPILWGCCCCGGLPNALCNDSKNMCCCPRLHRDSYDHIKFVMDGGCDFGE